MHDIKIFFSIGDEIASNVDKSFIINYHRYYMIIELFFGPKTTHSICFKTTSQTSPRFL